MKGGKEKEEACACGCCCGCGHKTCFGVGLIVLGVLWYLKNIDVLPALYFWPAILVLAGLGLLAKKFVACK